MVITITNDFFSLQVAALARRADRLEILARKLVNMNGELFPVPTDISNESEVLEAFTWIKENLGPIHVLINNAGLCQRSSILESTTDKWEDILKVNVIGLCIATRETVKDMRENETNGHIININSVLGHFIYHVSYANIYPASKHAVTALTEALRMELISLGTKIKITVS